MMMRVLIIDDEPLAREGVRLRLQKEKDVEIIGEIDSGRKAVEAIGELNPDLLFLDVQMPVLNGFDVLNRIDPEHMPVVIFVTAYDAYALDAFKAHALDYLLKPVEDERFSQSLNRARETIQNKQLSDFGQRIKRLLEDNDRSVHSFVDSDENARKAGKTLDRIAIKSRGKVTFLSVGEIDWIEAAGDYVYLHAGANKHLLREKIGYFEAHLPTDKFQRIHRSSIVNLDRIRELRCINPTEHAVLLSDGTTLKLSRSYSKKFQEAVGGFF